MSRILKSDDTIITQKFKGIGVHNGVDVVGANHTTCPVLAHSSGTVEMIQTGRGNNKNASGNESYGNFVKIKHSNNYSTLYAHLQDVYVKMGQAVSQGQEIGYIGDTGRSYGAHLHFEVRTNGTYNSIINPEMYINADLPGMGYKLTLDWQKCMNKTYRCNLVEDDNYGPDCELKASKFQLYYRQGNIMKNEMVRFVQQRLRNLGYNINVDGFFGPATMNTVKQFQIDRNLKVDGYVGKDTYRELLREI